MCMAFSLSPLFAHECDARGAFNLHNSWKTETPLTTHLCEEFTVPTFCLQAMPLSIWYNSLGSVGWEGQKLRHQWSRGCCEIISSCVDTYLLHFFWCICFILLFVLFTSLVDESHRLGDGNWTRMLQKQWVLLTAEPSLQPQMASLLMCPQIM